MRGLWFLKHLCANCCRGLLPPTGLKLANCNTPRQRLQALYWRRYAAGLVRGVSVPCFNYKVKSSNCMLSNSVILWAQIRQRTWLSLHICARPRPQIYFMGTDTPTHVAMAAYLRQSDCRIFCTFALTAVGACSRRQG